MCCRKVDESPICPENPSYPSSLPGLKTSHKDGLASSQLLSLLCVLEIDLESPVVESGVSNSGLRRFCVPTKRVINMLRLFVGPCSFLPISRVEPLGLLGWAGGVLFGGKVDVKKKPKLPKVPLWNWGVIPAAFQYFLVEDARFSQRKLLMSLKWLVFVGIPNSVSSSRANGIFGEPRHLPLTRYDWKVRNSQNPDSRHWHRTMWQCVVLNSWATKNLWSVSIQSLCWYQRREFCAFFVKQFHFGLTYKNKISSVRLGREPSFFMNLFTLAFQWFATFHTWNQFFFQGKVEAH